MYVWMCVLIAIATYVILAVVSERRAASSENELSIVRYQLSHTLEEIDEWHKYFGPNPRIYGDSPEGDDRYDHNDKTIAIDLDGVILEYVDPWNGPDHFGAPLPGAVEAITKLKNLGYEIAIYTTRNNSLAAHNQGHDAFCLTAKVREKLDEYGIPYDFISVFKPLARYYIDDRAVRFSGDWQNTLHEIGNRECERLWDRECDICKSLNEKT
jgi:hypothetical protein